jgi:hypothetical protein
MVRRVLEAAGPDQAAAALRTATADMVAALRGGE